MRNENLQQMRMSSHKRTTVTSVHLLVDVLVILIGRHFSVVEAILVPCCCSCILFWLPERNTHRVILRRPVIEKVKKTPTIRSFGLEMELRPWRDPLLMLENQVPFSTRFHCNTSFLLNMFSDVKSVKNVQRTAPFEHASVKYSLKAVCS